MQQAHPTIILKWCMNEGHKWIRENKITFLFFIFFLFLQDLCNFYLQEKLSFSEESSRWIEMAFQFLLLWTSVLFFHTVNSKLLSRPIGPFKTLLESLLLLPGFVLQSILWILSTLLGAVFLIIPGIYFGVICYLAPMLSVIYPDYSGYTFKLSQVLARKNLKGTFVLVLTTSLIPFIPEGFLFFLTGTFKSIWSLIYSPIGAGLYLYCELVFLFFVYALVKEHRSQSEGAPSISS